MTPEARARQSIDALLAAAGWHVCNVADANIHAARGVAIREFPLNPGHGFADYLLYIDAKAAGVIEAKKEGATLTGVEVQSARYAQGLPASLPAWRRPLPFSFESTGIETHFTNGLDPQPRARAVFAFHRPETLAQWLIYLPAPADAASVQEPTPTFLARLQTLPPLIEAGLWPAQIVAIRNLENILKANKPRALIQMATGSGKTFTAISFIYRLIKFAGARRVLFLVDRGNLGPPDQERVRPVQLALQQLQVQRGIHRPAPAEQPARPHGARHHLHHPAHVLHAQGPRAGARRRRADSVDGWRVNELGNLFKQPEPIAYNPAFPIETFDIIVTDEAHRSIYNLWRQVLEYFDAYLIGLTATPSKQTFGFFNQNLVMEYGHQQAVADGVNVNYDVYRIRTASPSRAARSKPATAWATATASRARPAGRSWTKTWPTTPTSSTAPCSRPTRSAPWCAPSATGCSPKSSPAAPKCPRPSSSPRTTTTPRKSSKSCARNSARATTSPRRSPTAPPATRPSALISAFRNSYFPRIAVTVDMIATGTDIKPVEIVMFMRAVKSRNFFEQMKGRGVRIIPPTTCRPSPPTPAPRTTSSSSIAWACASRTRPTPPPWTRRSPCPSTNCCRPWRWATWSPRC
jgi:type I restriction enzyme R subunit